MAKPDLPNSPRSLCVQTAIKPSPRRNHPHPERKLCQTARELPGLAAWVREEGEGFCTGCGLVLDVRSIVSTLLNKQSFTRRSIHIYLGATQQKILCTYTLTLAACTHVLCAAWNHLAWTFGEGQGECDKRCTCLLWPMYTNDNVRVTPKDDNVKTMPDGRASDVQNAHIKPGHLAWCRRWWGEAHFLADYCMFATVRFECERRGAIETFSITLTMLAVERLRIFGLSTPCVDARKCVPAAKLSYKDQRRPQ